MNKKFTSFFENYGMQIQGNLAEGTIDGFEASASVQTMSTNTPLILHLVFYATEETKREIAKQIRDLKIKYLTLSPDAYGISLGLNDITVNRLLKRLPEKLEQIIRVLKNNNVLGKGYCPVCGDALELDNQKKYNVNGAFITLDEKCVENLNAVIAAENKEFEEAPNNYGLGLIGALLGAIVGAISYIVLFFIGYISSISSFISILLGTFLYKKLGGKQNKMMVVIVSLVSVLAMLAVVFVIYVLAANGLVLDYGYKSTGLNAFVDMMKEPDFRTEFIANMAMTVLFSVIGVVAQVVYLIRSVRRTQEIK